MTPTVTPCGIEAVREVGHIIADTLVERRSLVVMGAEFAILLALATHARHSPLLSSCGSG